MPPVARGRAGFDHDEPAEGLVSLAWSLEAAKGCVEPETALRIVGLTSGLLPVDSRMVYNTGSTLGTDVAGNAVSVVQVYVRDGTTQTAFPVAVPR